MAVADHGGVMEAAEAVLRAPSDVSTSIRPLGSELGGQLLKSGLAPSIRQAYGRHMDDDPVATNPQLYSVVFENERVRVLEYRDEPGAESTTHRHPDSVMVTLSDFERRLSSGGRQVDVSLTANQARWLPAQAHSGTNTGSTETHVIFVELKELGTEAHWDDEALGPQ